MATASPLPWTYPKKRALLARERRKIPGMSSSTAAPQPSCGSGVSKSSWVSPPLVGGKIGRASSEAKYSSANAEALARRRWNSSGEISSGRMRGYSTHRAASAGEKLAGGLLRRLRSRGHRGRDFPDLRLACQSGTILSGDTFQDQELGSAFTTTRDIQVTAFRVVRDGVTAHLHGKLMLVDVLAAVHIDHVHNAGSAGGEDRVNGGVEPQPVYPCGGRHTRQFLTCLGIQRQYGVAYSNKQPARSWIESHTRRLRSAELPPCLGLVLLIEYDYFSGVLNVNEHAPSLRVIRHVLR